LNDHKKGQAAAITNFKNAGQVKVSGNHNIKNTDNTGNFVNVARTFDAKGRPVKMMLMDLAQVNNFNNLDNGVLNVTGTHGIKNLNNAKKGKVMFNDHKGG